jgi:kynurenine formamidase
MPQLIDLSHTIEHGMMTYKGLPGPVISDHLSREASRTRYAAGTEFQIGKIEMVANTGTYIDSPFHRYAEGKDLAALPLESIANLDGIIIRWNLSNGRAVDAASFKSLVLKGKAVLIQTGWDKHWRTEQYFDGHPYLPEATVKALLHGGTALVGIDSFNIDDIAGGARPAHSLLLGANIPIVEHLCNLQQLPDTGFKFFAVPVKVKNFGSFPVRAFAIID